MMSAAVPAPIKQATSAFGWFQKEHQSRIRAELEGRGEPHGLGEVQKALGLQWRELDLTQKAHYEDLAARDRQRFEEEAAERDRIVEEEQARRRKEREVEVLDTRMRERHVEETHAKPRAPRPKKELTEEEIERKRQVQAERAARDATLGAEHAALAKERAKQAEARLNYLLKQSDVFAHFGLKKKGQPMPAFSEDSAPGPSEAKTTGGPGRRAKHRQEEDKDDDEVQDEGEAHFLLKQPSSIKNGDLRPYQLEGLNWMIRLQDNGINGILADEMGLGKTLQSIAVLAYNYEYLNVDGPHLILVPKSTLANWCNEFRKWCPIFRVLRFHGTKEERQEIIQERLAPGTDRDWDVLITTYEVCNLEKNALGKFAWQYLIIDEAHRLKNEASQFSKTVRQLETGHRLLITGTPLQNNLHELWALLNFLLPDVFSSSEQFDDWFDLQIDDAEQKQRLITQLHKILRPFMLRRLKADVESSLPPKTETLVFCEMSGLQRETYKKVLERDLSVVAGSENAGRTAVLNIVMQLRKVCNHPYLFNGVEDRTLDPLGEHVIQNCGKMVLLNKLLRRLHDKGHRVLVFCQMTRMLDILEDFMIMCQYEYCRIDGNTTYEERENLIDAYNAPGSSKFCFLLSTRAGGLGINLQTADTVILYDSDWNPQADLQAQDRAHRIGQRRPVNIYRLVTHGTIEEKIVERAQKKLKLDAMVVQQGRLQNKDKMSKDELLDAIRYGADMIFRSKDNNITDEDIDLILERGRKITAEIEEKLKAAEKGDLLDFRLDGGMSAQVFEGQDYSRGRGNRDGLIPAQMMMFDIGKRERKPVGNLSEGALQKRLAETDGRKKSKLPKHLRLPKIDENWMFYNRERLHELHAIEEAEYSQLKEDGELPAEVKDLQLLPPELQEEKARLLAEGFGNWTKADFNGFVRASAKYGRTEYSKIAAELGKTEEEVVKYAKVFWRKGETEFSEAEWKKIVTSVEKGERKLEEIARLSKATQELVTRFRNPWEELTFQYAGGVGKERMFSSEEDRFLLCFANHYGYGNWDKVKLAIRRCDRFRFDYFLRSCSSDNLGKRCEQLMRAAEKENTEYEKRRQAVEDSRRKEREERLLEDNKREREDEERRRRLAEVEHSLHEQEAKISEVADAKKSAELRLQMLKNAKTAPQNGDSTVGPTGKPRQSYDGSQPLAKQAKSEGKSHHHVSKSVPEEVLPELAALVVETGPGGLSKIVTAFLSKYGEVSKRQAELKINEIAVKEKPEGEGVTSTRPVWQLKPEYQHLYKPELAAAAKARLQKLASQPQPEKRKRESTGEDVHSSTPREPKKARNAVTLYLVDKKDEVKKELGPTATNDEIKDRIKTMWKAERPDVKEYYSVRAREEEERYQREYMQYMDSQEARKRAMPVSEADDRTAKRPREELTA